MSNMNGMKSILLTGANRGLGLEFVRQYARLGWNVFACCRHPEQSEALKRLTSTHKNLSLYALDVSNPEQIIALSKKLSDTPIDVLLNNAGYYGHESNRLGHIDKADWMRVFEVNTIAPLQMAEAFMTQLKKGRCKIIATISSKMGSIKDNNSGSMYAYRSSKTALNQVMKSLSIDLAEQGIKVAIFHPGWVKTDMGGPNALQTPEQSVQSLMSIINGLTLEKSGKFINYDGTELPW